MHKYTMKDKFYVYAYLRYTTATSIGTPYYIGKGTGSRAFVKHRNAIAPVDRSRIVMLKENLSEQHALELEKFLISWYGRKDLGTGILINVTDGGEGLSNPSIETRKMMADAKRNESIETRKKRSLAARNRPVRPTTEETKLKISLANKGKTRSIESKEKMAAAKKGKSRSADAIAKSAAGLKGKKKPVATCPHCGTTGGISAMHRWHFERCKINQENQN